MTAAAQLELPLFEPFRSTPDNPVAEQERTHPAQMIIKHCGNPKNHPAHGYDEPEGAFGCPATPDLRDTRPAVADAWIASQSLVEMPAYYRPMPLSNGEIDRCAARRDGERCAWIRHFGREHSFGHGERFD